MDVRKEFEEFKEFEASCRRLACRRVGVSACFRREALVRLKPRVSLRALGMPQKKRRLALKARKKWGPRVDPLSIQEPSAKEPYRPIELRHP